MLGSALHRAARALAAAEVPVFPCAVDGKIPATKHGFKDATVSILEIDRWWAEADYNIGVSPDHAGWAVVDLDVKMIDGLAAWERLQSEHGKIGATRTHSTPSGGRHLIFEGTCATSAGKLAKGVDTRGEGGYILWPPSIVGGKPYTVERSGTPIPLPAWVATALATTATTRGAPDGIILDIPANIPRAMSALHKDLARGIPAEGEGSDTRAVQLALMMRDNGLSDEKIADLMHEHWAPHFDRDWIELKVGNADASAQNERGVDAVVPAASVEQFAIFAASQPIEVPKRSRFYPESPAEQNDHPAPTWLLDGLLPDGALALVFGASGSFKTYLMLDWALSIANGVETAFGAKPAAGVVFYGALEGRFDIKQRRKAWEIQHGIESNDYPFYLLPAPYISSNEQCEEFIGQLRLRLGGRRCAAIWIDTIFKAMTGLKLTSDEHSGLFVAFCQRLRDEFNCAIVAIHHPSKGDMTNAYGSYTLVAGFDTVARVERIPKTLNVSFTVQQHRDAAEPAEPFHFKGREIGKGLVFERVAGNVAALAAQAHDPLSRTSVGGALQALGAGDTETAVVTHVLATQLAGEIKDEATEAQRERIAEIARRLGALSQKSLAGYCVPTSKGLTWFLPNGPAA